jgi:hypothetical protein
MKQPSHTWEIRIGNHGHNNRKFQTTGEMSVLGTMNRLREPKTLKLGPKTCKALKYIFFSFKYKYKMKVSLF